MVVRLVVVGAAIVGAAAVARCSAGFLRVDACLDRGGRWDEERAACDMAAPADSSRGTRP